MSNYPLRVDGTLSVSGVCSAFVVSSTPRRWGVRSVFSVTNHGSASPVRGESTTGRPALMEGLASQNCFYTTRKRGAAPAVSRQAGRGQEL